jgi:hypothetical protein
MSLEDLGNIGELIAAIGVIVSLVYLAVQMRQNTAALQSGSRQQVASAYRAGDLPRRSRGHPPGDRGSSPHHRVNPFGWGGISRRRQGGYAAPAG